MPRRAGTSALRVRWIETAILVGRLMRALSRWLRIGAGGVIGGRVVLALAPGALSRLAEGRRVVLVSGTNGKTTTAHLIAAALRTAGPVAHNDTGANMPDGLVAALAADRAAPFAVLEVDELYLGAIAEALQPDVLVLLNLTRDQLDRGFEVQAVAESVSAAVAKTSRAVVVANGDDPNVVAAVGKATRVVWVGAGAEWQADALGGTTPPPMSWTVKDGAVRGPEGSTPVRLALPGRFNLGNAAMTMATAAALGVPPAAAAAAISGVTSIAGRYSLVERGPHLLRLLLAKNPAGWSELMPLIAQAPAVLLVINAQEADGRDTSWLWDVPFEQLAVPCVVASGERAADVGLRLSYAGIEHVTEPDPLMALERMPSGEVQVVANYTAFLGLRRRLGTEVTS
ncbi:MAG TPA: MurT ligase domain-containing protein [Blastococcus sp.]|jgi:UDP-N-acetylmuramyl tripeptide synthase|nr:MurT ligase domain-containing protein [Blastococcus sp.]